MGLYLDTSGMASRAVAICGRCSTKVPYSSLVEDGDKPGLRVCPECRDVLDPWKLTPRAVEDVTLQYPRPETALTVPADGLDDVANWGPIP